MVGLVDHMLRALIVPPQVVQMTKIGTGVGLPTLVTELSDQLEGMVEHLLRALPIPPQVVHAAEVGEGGGLPAPVVGAFGGGQRGVVDAQSLVPGAAGSQI